MLTEAQIRAQFLALPIDPFFPSLCTIVQHDGALGDDGQLDFDSSHYAAISPEATNIPCRKVPLILQRVSNKEGRHPDSIEVEESFQVVLRGLFEEIEFYMYADIDGVRWLINADETPGNKIYTRFRISKINT